MMKIVCIGDSLVTGFPYEPAQSWVAYFRAASGYKATNRGVNGESAAQVLSRFQRDVLSQKPDGAFILCGTNDFVFQTAAPSETMSSLAEMVRLCRENNIFPAMMTPLPVDAELASSHWVSGTDYDSVNQDILTLCGLMKEFSEAAGTALFPLHDMFQTLLSPEHKTRYLWDGIHPTEEGHRAIARFVTGRAKEFLPG